MQRCLYYVRLIDKKTNSIFYKIGLETTAMSRWISCSTYSVEYLKIFIGEDETCQYVESIIKSYYNTGVPNNYLIFKKHGGASEAKTYDFLDSIAPFTTLIPVMLDCKSIHKAHLKNKQREGIERAKKAGKYHGRPKLPKPKNWNEIIKLWYEKELTAVEAYTKLNIGKTSFYKYIKEE